jgi:hypothetical protein
MEDEELLKQNRPPGPFPVCGSYSPPLPPGKVVTTICLFLQTHIRCRIGQVGAGEPQSSACWQGWVAGVCSCKKPIKKQNPKPLYYENFIKH